MFIALQPQRMYCSPEFGGKFLEEARSLVFVVGFVGKSQVLMLEGDPVGGVVAIEEVIPANALLRMVEREVLLREHVRRVMGMGRVKEKKKGMPNQGAQRGI